MNNFANQIFVKQISHTYQLKQKCVHQKLNRLEICVAFGSLIYCCQTQPLISCSSVFEVNSIESSRYHKLTDMSNSKILEKKNWVVKMIVLDAKDAEISDISHIKMYDDSSKNSTIATKKVRFL